MTGKAARDGCALVTGASRGIGAATAVALARDNWAVGVGYREDADGAKRVTRQIESLGGRAVELQADISEPDAADRLFSPLEERFGPVFVLVNNAAIRADALSPRLDDDSWGSVLDTNLSAAFRLTRRALGPMIRTHFGRIINVASVVGQRANPGQANYAASKGGLIALTKTVAAEVARRGITVNAIAPGFVDTDMTADLDRSVLDSIPARRPGTPEEVAACVRFLASEEASYVTGSTLTVDGGLTA